MARRHETATFSFEKSTLAMLERLARKRGRKWSKSAFVSNAVREAAARDLEGGKS